MSSGDPVPMDSTWRRSVLTFLSRGLTLDELKEFIDITMNEPKVFNKEAWRYFCGCCWRELTTRTELARQLLEDGLDPDGSSG